MKKTYEMIISKVIAEEEISFESRGCDPEVLVISSNSFAISSNTSGINITVISLSSAANELLTSLLSS